MAREQLRAGQQQLAETLFSTSTVARIKRREALPDGSFRFSEVTRETGLVALSEHPGEFALKLHERVPNAPLSPLYINLRNLSPEVLIVIAKSLAELELPTDPDVVTGIPNAGDPIARAYSQITGVPFVEVFEKLKTSDGKGLIIPGEEVARGYGKKLLLTDDLITGADTKHEAINAAETLGYKIVGAVVAIDREQGGSAQLERWGYPLRASLKLSELLRYGLETGRMTENKFIEIKNYLNAQDKK